MYFNPSCGWDRIRHSSIIIIIKIIIIVIDKIRDLFKVKLLIIRFYN